LTLAINVADKKTKITTVTTINSSQMDSRKLKDIPIRLRGRGVFWSSQRARVSVVIREIKCGVELLFIHGYSSSQG